MRFAVCRNKVKHEVDMPVQYPGCECDRSMRWGMSASRSLRATHMQDWSG